MVFTRRQLPRLELRSRTVPITPLTKRSRAGRPPRGPDHLNRSTGSDRPKELEAEKNDGDVGYLRDKVDGLTDEGSSTNEEKMQVPTAPIPFHH